MLHGIPLQDNSGTVDVSGNAYATNVSFTAWFNAGETGLDFQCSYVGTPYHTPVDSMAGTMRCGVQNLIDGTWRLTR